VYVLKLIQMLQEVLHDWLGTSPQAGLITNIVLVLLTILLFWVVYVIVFRVFNLLAGRVMKEDSQVRPLRIQKQEILSAPEVATILNRVYLGISWILRLYIIFMFVNTLLGLFDWTRGSAEAIARIVASLFGGIWDSFTSYLPDLLTAIVIIGIAHIVIRLCKLVFDGMARQRIKVPGFYPEWSRTSFNLLRVFIVALTLVVVFPYLPGSDSPAFQGVSIFFGVLLSLGSTSAVANVIAGIVITYTRAFRVGDWVEVSGTEGKIFERTAFVTRIRTAKNVEISVPNSSIMSDKVVNYSSQAKQVGIALHTGVTIGYDVPWPKVQELLLSAAAATEHIEEEPTPFVLQTALDDNYVAYELNAFTKKVGLRPRIYSDLHANILDAFHTAGIEITSPHYRAVRDGNEPAIAAVMPRPEGGQTAEES
jgi:small-conductance mechanosensitive channel